MGRVGAEHVHRHLRQKTGFDRKACVALLVPFIERLERGGYERFDTAMLAYDFGCPNQKEAHVRTRSKFRLLLQAVGPRGRARNLVRRWRGWAEIAKPDEGVRAAILELCERLYQTLQPGGYFANQISLGAGKEE